MLYLSKFSIYSIFSTIALLFSCNSLENSKQNSIVIENTEIKNFEEMRRLNYNIDLKETTVLNSFQDILALYQKLEDTKYSKGFPIPSLEENETLIVLKPKLKIEKYGDLEIIEIQNKKENLLINYKEIPNSEYEKNRLSNPILIIKTPEKFKTIQLTLKS